MAILFGKRQRRLSSVLIVEDEPLIAFDNERFLTDEGFNVIATVDRAAQAIALIDGDAAIDLVVADLCLSDGSGVGVARAAAARGIPVLWATADCPEDARALAHGWLAKPYLQRDLRRAIDAIEALVTGTQSRRFPTGFELLRAAG